MAKGTIQSKKASAKKASPMKASPKKASPKKASPKKASPKKASPKKASPKKASPKKASPKKASPKKASPKKASPKKASPKKGAVKSTTRLAGKSVISKEGAMMGSFRPYDIVRVVSDDIHGLIDSCGVVFSTGKSVVVNMATESGMVTREFNSAQLKKIK